VTPRERWQALQTQLTLSRSHLDEGNFAAALEAVDVALALDPDFLAALALRGRIISLAPDLPVTFASPLPQVMPPPSEVQNVAPVAAETPAAEEASRKSAEVVSTAVPLEMPLVAPAAVADEVVPVDAADDLPLQVARAAGPSAPSADASAGHQPLELRARRRRVDRRLDAVRAALAAGRLKEAASGLDEVIELDPNQPELRELAAEYASLKKNLRHPRTGRWLAAAAAFGGVVLGASWLQDATGLWSRQTVGVSSLIAPPPPLTVTLSASAVEPEPDEPSGTSGFLPPVSRFPALSERDSSERPVAEVLDRRLEVHPNETATAFAENATSLSQVQTPQVVRASSDATGGAGLPGDSTASAVAPIGPATAVPGPPPAASPSPAVVRPPDDQVKISQVLQRYRAAYESLDARSAHAVWPSVNEAALARAFDDLASQRLVFEGCDVRLRGDAAADATCHGTAQYVPKVGNRDPRVEPRTWNFTLRRSGTDWNIVSARAQR
jgi:tetratricopeptide (TPR) repeat protein